MCRGADYCPHIPKEAVQELGIQGDVFRAEIGVDSVLILLKPRKGIAAS
jgi:hypothetical protein